MKQEPTLRDDNAPRPESDTSLLWSDARLLGFHPMDESHKEFYDVAFRLLTCTQDSAAEALEAFEEHLAAHFGQEEEWMRSTDFPPYECHMQEHGAVMNATKEVRELFQRGEADVTVVHSFAIQLFQWFPGHADYLDASLAAWMSKRTFGGRPVVLRRKI